MGRSYTPKYRVEYHNNTDYVDGRVPSMYPQWMHWPRDLGKPSNAKAEKLRCDMNSTFQPGGVNEHVNRNVTIHIHTLRVIEQATGETVAEANMPMFEVA